MSYHVIIPTYKRSQTLIKKTLNTLLNTDIKLLTNLHIFVADEEELSVYSKELPAAIVPSIKIGKRGIPNQRNYIQKYFPVGTRLFMIDDDISKIVTLERKKSVQLHNLNEFIIKAFNITDQLGLKMWGVNANTNPLNMQDKISVGLIYLVGNFIGIINTHDPEIMVDEGELIPARRNFSAGKESHERVLRHYIKYGGVVKFKNVGVESAYWKEDGGHQVSRTIDGELEAAKILCSKYPDLTKYRDFNGVPDLQLVTGQTKTYEYHIGQGTIELPPAQPKNINLFEL